MTLLGPMVKSWCSCLLCSGQAIGRQKIAITPCNRRRLITKSAADAVFAFPTHFCFESTKTAQKQAASALLLFEFSNWANANDSSLKLHDLAVDVAIGSLNQPRFQDRIAAILVPVSPIACTKWQNI